MNNTIEKLLNMVGLRLTRVDSKLEERWTMLAGLRRCKELGASPSTIIDLGAAAGKWSTMARKVFPPSKILLCEPLPDRRQVLDSFCANDKNAKLVAAIIGAEDGENRYNRTDDLDGSGVYREGQAGTETLTLPMRSIDSLVAEHALTGPFLIKFDTHGFEIPILDGLQKTLLETEFVVMEVYTHHVSPSAKRFWEMCETMSKLGFRPFYLADPLARPLDRTLWQLDIFFAKQEHPLFTNTDFAEV